MEYREVLDFLAPCGLNCRRCFAHSEGEIKMLSARLLECLGSFDKYAEKFSVLLSVLKNYPSFKDLLTFFAQGDCKGCRKGTCRFPEFNCRIMTCYQEKGVDFCFQCDEFPCHNALLTNCRYYVFANFYDKNIYE
ncbi:MAG: DUF3795 domain-containing protein [Candidatus Edwardsbacteria bacterium]